MREGFRGVREIEVMLMDKINKKEISFKYK